MIEQILSEAESLLPESHVAILAQEVKRLRERPDADALQKLLNEAYRKGNQDAHAARDVCKVILPESVLAAKATSCTGCIGASFDGRFQCAGCTDFSKYEPLIGAVVDANYLSDLEEAIIDVSKELKGGKVLCENCGESVKTNEVNALLCLDPMLPRIAQAFALRSVKAGG